MSKPGPLADVVAQQYERWMYPAPIFDLPVWLEDNWQWFDPSHAHRLFWPDREYPVGLDILVAGCGTNQAAVIAYTNPTARVVAIDVSEASLGHHRHLQSTYGLENLELHHLPIEQVASLERDFDLIISTGVLHHLEDPQRGMDALARCLRAEGVVALMLYATYGRIGVQMMQSVFAELGLKQDAGSLDIVREAIPALDPVHPLWSYLGIAPDLADDSGLVDTFLHGRERTYTIDECRDLVDDAGLMFQDLFLKAPYFAPRGTGNPFFDAIGALPREQQWSIMERVNPRNACHFFLACRPERPRERFSIDFAGDAALALVPSLRKGCRLEGEIVHRSAWQMPLTPLHVALVRRVDGERSIAQIIEDVVGSGDVALPDGGDAELSAREFFLRLWQLDFIAVGIRGGE